MQQFNFMPRILGVNVPEEKRTEFRPYIFERYRSFSSRKILKEAGIDFNKRARKSHPEEVGKIQK